MDKVFIENVLENEKILDNLLTKVSTTAKRLIKKHNWASRFYDDLISEGYLALIRATNRFKVANNIQFWTYAQHRVEGAMQDFIRVEGHLRKKSVNKIISFPFDTDAFLIKEGVNYSIDTRNNIPLFMYSITKKLKDSCHIKIIELLSEGYNQKEIAVILGYSQANICVLVKKIRKEINYLL